MLALNNQRLFFGKKNSVCLPKGSQKCDKEFTLAVI